MSKQKKNRKVLSKNLGDVTINDFANSTVCKNRLKKSSGNVSTVIKKVLEEDNKTWEEKLDLYEGDFELVEVLNEDETTSVVIKKPSPRKDKASGKENYLTGNEYPIDIWFLISEYIRPEDVGRFAGICKTSLEVTQSANFWFSLYKKYYTSVPNLPERLQPECLHRKYGIKTAVIRSLQYTYSPFVSRTKSIITFEKHPDVLKKKICISMWFQKNKQQWIYCFKMRGNTLDSTSRRQKASHKPDLIEMLDDVNANEDENCTMLQVTSLDFACIPPVIGLTLTSVSLTLAHGFRHHRLQLKFGSQIQSNSTYTDGASSINVILDPVINVKILDWWHPLYPHSHNMQQLLNLEKS